MNTQTYKSSAELSSFVPDLEEQKYKGQKGTVRYWVDTFIDKKTLSSLRQADPSDIPSYAANQLIDFLEWIEEDMEERLKQVIKSRSMIDAIFAANHYLTILGYDLSGNGNMVSQISETSPSQNFDIDIADQDGKITETESYWDSDSYSVEHKADGCLTFSCLAKKIREKIRESVSQPEEQVIQDSRGKICNLMGIPRRQTPPPLPGFNNNGEREIPVIPNSKGHVPPPLSRINGGRNKLQLVFSVGASHNTPPEYEKIEIIEGVRDVVYQIAV